MKQIFILIYAVFLIIFLGGLSGVFPIVMGLYENETAHAHKELAKGVFFLLSKELEGLDEISAREKIERLQPEFGYPLTLSRVDDVVLDKKYQKEFMDGRIIRDEERNLHLLRLENLDLALVTGPYLFEKIISKARRFSWIIMSVFLILPAGIWTFVLQRNLKKIEKVTQKFVEGDHSARLQMSDILPLGKIAGTFNYMAEQTQNLIESQKDLVNAVSHEIRTPLARIKFSLEMLKGSMPERSAEKGYAGEISKDVDEISSLVDEMLTYARFEREPASTERLQENETIAWLKGIVNTEQENISHARISFQTEGAGDVYVAKFEPVYLGWVVRNLIRNAARYAETKIHVTLQPEKGCYCIHVDDDGPGIPAAAREKIFEPFFRLSQNHHRKSGGYGLGLAIAKRITLWHKGRVKVDVSPMQGARFSLELPAE